MIFQSHAHPALIDLRNLQALAGRLLEDFRTGRSAEQMLPTAELIQQLYDTVSTRIPDHQSKGFLSKHIHFLVLYLSQGSVEDCREDIEDICSKDIPRLCSFLEANSLEARYDAELSRRVFPLLQHQQLDAAVRASFVVLKTRLVNTFDLSARLDGTALVNALFGGSGKITTLFDKDEAQALRNLLDGLYGVFRNNFSHNVVEAEWEDAAAVIAMINTILKSIDHWNARMPPGPDGVHKSND